PAVDVGHALTATLATPLAGAKAETVLTVRGTRSLRVEAGTGGSLLLATDGGVFEADPATATLTRRVALAGPFRGLLGGDDGTVATAATACWTRAACYCPPAWDVERGDRANAGP
ncbi:MAG TPA: hypothetical protein VGF17_17115, partial [Phytomonospora sp.]